MDINMIIKEITLDDEKRIIVTAQDMFAEQLKSDEVKQSIKQMTQGILKDDFKLLEVGKGNCRLTVTEGKEEECLEIVKIELAKALEMAMAFMNSQNK